MSRPGLIRGLRIAWTAAFGMFCVLLVTLWVRSQSWVDGVSGPVFGAIVFGVGSMPGSGGIGISTDVTSKWELASQPADEWWEMVSESEPVPFSSRLWGGFVHRSGGIAAPYWFWILLSSIASTLPWLSWKFSFRTLLIATTLIAVVLGLVVWSSS